MFRRSANGAPSSRQQDEGVSEGLLAKISPEGVSECLLCTNQARESIGKYRKHPNILTHSSCGGDGIWENQCFASFDVDYNTRHCSVIL